MSESTIPQTADLRLYMSRRQLADKFGCTTRTVIWWEREKGLPSRLVFGGNRRFYFLPEVEQWMRTCPGLKRKHREVQLCN